MKNFLKTPGTRTTILILGGVAIFLAAFGLGMAFGYEKAMFAGRWGDNYYRNFYGRAPGGFMGPMMDHAPWNAHGVVGTVIDVSSSTISVRDNNNNERSIAILPSTVIRRMNDTISLASVAAGDHITAIGEPNDQGQIQGRFIRVLTASSSALLPPMQGGDFH